MAQIHFTLTHGCNVFDGTPDVVASLMDSPESSSELERARVRRVLAVSDKLKGQWVQNVSGNF